MQIKQVIDVIEKELILERTPKGRPITDRALSFLQSTIEDKKNWHNDAVKCKNCGIILSSLLVPEGCPNCGSKDLGDINEKIETKN